MRCRDRHPEIKNAGTLESLSDPFFFVITPTHAPLTCTQRLVLSSFYSRRSVYDVRVAIIMHDFVIGIDAMMDALINVDNAIITC